MRWRFCVCFWLNRFTSDGFSSTCLNAYAGFSSFGST